MQKPFSRPKQRDQCIDWAPRPSAPTSTFCAPFAYRWPLIRARWRARRRQRLVSKRERDHWSVKNNKVPASLMLTKRYFCSLCISLQWQEHHRDNGLTSEVTLDVAESFERETWKCLQQVTAAWSAVSVKDCIMLIRNITRAVIHHCSSDNKSHNRLLMRWFQPLHWGSFLSEKI